MPGPRADWNIFLHGVAVMVCSAAGLLGVVVLVGLASGNAEFTFMTLVAVVFATPPVLYLLMRWIPSWGYRPWQCRRCGYDLRATPDHLPCPECGWDHASRTPRPPGP